MTRLTYSLDEISGDFEIKPDGSVAFKEEDGIDYAAVTVQLPGEGGLMSPVHFVPVSGGGGGGGCRDGGCTSNRSE